MPSLQGKDYVLDTIALRQYLIGKGLMEGSTKYNKVWFKCSHKFRKG